MDKNNNQSISQNSAISPINQTEQSPVIPQSKTAKILQDTAEAAAVVGVIAGLANTLKGLFGKK